MTGSTSEPSRVGGWGVCVRLAKMIVCVFVGNKGQTNSVQNTQLMLDTLQCGQDRPGGAHGTDHPVQPAEQWLGN